MMINARSETVARKPAFRSAFKKKRCLVIADGFYEWRTEGKKKFPMYIRLKSGECFAFAGLYNLWTSPDGKQACTCTIITTEANEAIKPIHDRMPVILPRDKEDIWLDPVNEDQNRLLLNPQTLCIRGNGGIRGFNTGKSPHTTLHLIFNRFNEPNSAFIS